VGIVQDEIHSTGITAGKYEADASTSAAHKLRASVCGRDV
jgi:hypothetical protein